MTLSKPMVIISAIMVLTLGIILGYISSLDLFENCTTSGCGYTDFWTWLKCHTIMYCD